MNRDLEGFSGHFDELTHFCGRRIFGSEKLDSTRESKAGMIDDVRQAWWCGEVEGSWLDGLARMAFQTGNATMTAKVKHLLSAVMNAQEDDGYIGVYNPETRYRHRADNGELWAQSRIFLALLAYHEAGGDTRALDCVVRAAQLTMSRYDDRHSYFVNERPAGGTGHGLMFTDALDWLHRLTGDKSYVDFAAFCYRDYCRSWDIRDSDNQLDNLLNLDKPMWWHTPHVVEHARVPLLLYYATGDKAFKTAFENSFRKIANHSVPTGPCIGDENVFGRPPCPHTPYEYCTITEQMTSLLRAAERTGDSTYADWAERLAFNAAQGARLADGSAVSYLTTDNRYSAVCGFFGGKLMYSSTHEQAAPCCPVNAIKLMPYYVQSMWMRSRRPEEGLVAMLYGPCRLRTAVAGVPVSIKAKTAFPFEDSVTLTIRPESPVEFPLRLRTPEWCDAMRVSCEGATAYAEDGFHVVKKKWREGDTVSVDWSVRVTEEVAVTCEAYLRRGPLLYAKPIPCREHVLKDYGKYGARDLDIFPLDGIHGDYALPGGSPPPAPEFQRSVSPGDAEHPWENPPVALMKDMVNLRTGKVETQRLIPFGATLLRRLTFPAGSYRH